MSINKLYVMMILFVWQPTGLISLQTMQYKSHIQKSQDKNTTI